MQFITSWDDGYHLDLRIADLLDRYECTGTFYICPTTQHEAKMLSSVEVRMLAKKHAIGAHSLTHPKLTTLSDKDLENEIRGSKQWVEKLTGQNCDTFCYPYGNMDQRVCVAVKAAGFHAARTTQRWCFSTTDPYRTPVSLQIAPYPFRRRFRPAWKLFDPLGPLRESWPHVHRFGLPIKTLRSWSSLAIALFEWAKENDQPYFHLYGHSREVEQYGMWKELELFLQHVQARMQK